MSSEYLLDAEAAALIQALLRQVGKTGNEVSVILAGRRRDEGGVVLDRVVIPRQTAYRSEYGCGLVIEGGCLNRIGPSIRADGRRIHGILHSHPDEAFHSETDEAAVLFRFHGAFSIVIPRFGESGRLLDRACAFRFDYDRGWLEVDPSELITIHDAGPYEVIHDD